MFIPNNRSAVELQGSYDLDVYVERFGTHGYFEHEGNFLEIKQLNFMDMRHLPRYRKHGICKIPNIEGMLSYSMAIYKHPLGVTMLTRGMQYNLPIGSKTWGVRSKPNLPVCCVGGCL